MHRKVWWITSYHREAERIYIAVHMNAPRVGHPLQQFVGQRLVVRPQCVLLRSDSRQDVRVLAQVVHAPHQGRSRGILRDGLPT